MQVTNNSNDRLGACHLDATSHFALLQGAFETRHQPAREVSVVDGLISVTQHAWGLHVETRKCDAGAVTAQ